MDKKEIIESIGSKSNGEIYLGVVGAVRTGKSTFINALVSSIGRKGNITTSVLPNTTTEYIKIKINEKLSIIDTPGFIEKNTIYNYITKEIMPKKEIKPKIMQTKSGFTVIVNDILRIDNIGKEKANLIFYMNNNMNLDTYYFDFLLLCFSYVLFLLRLVHSSQYLYKML